jgi:hypothetical protein
MVWDLLSTNCWQLCSMWLLSVKEEFCCCVTLLIRVRESRDYGVYDYDPAAAKGRIDCIYDELEGFFEFIEPVPAVESDLLLVHEQSHVDYVKSKGIIYEVALFAAGGAIG